MSVWSGIYACLLVVLLPVGVLAQSQYSGTIRGYVFDEYKEPLVVATVILVEKGIPLRATVSDMDGFYEFTELKPGEFEIIVRFLGWQDSVSNVRLPANQILQLKDIVVPLTDGIIHCDFHLPNIPLIDPFQQESQTVFRREQVDRFPGR